MNKKEIEIISKNYKSICKNVIMFNNEATYEILKRNTRDMLIELNLKDLVFNIENEVISENKEYNILQQEMFKLIYDNFKKYNQYIHYDLEEIEIIYNELKYEMSEEENKCHISRIKNITEL